MTIRYLTHTSNILLNGTAGSLINLLDNTIVLNSGWTKVYSGTNKAIYKNASNKLIRVQDDGNTLLTTTASAGTTKDAVLIACESATDVDTMTNIYPSSAQLSTALQFKKSNTADSISRPYCIIYNEKFFYLFNDPLNTNFNNIFEPIFFGDVISYKTNDVYNTVIHAVESVNSNSSTSNTFNTQISSLPASQTCTYKQRDIATTTISKKVGKINGLIVNTFNYLNFDGIIKLNKINIIEDSVFYGYFPNIYTTDEQNLMYNINKFDFVNINNVDYIYILTNNNKVYYIKLIEE